MNLDIHKIKPITFATFIFIIIANLCPGIIFVYLFNKNLFIQLDSFKLIFLALSITFPIWLINVVIGMIPEPEIHPKSDPIENLQASIIITSFLSMMIIYLPIVIKLFLNINIQTVAIIVGGWQLLIFVVTLMVASYRKDNKQKKAN